MKDDQVNGGDFGLKDDGVTDDQDDEEVFEHLAVADLAVSARHPAGAGDWPAQGGIGQLHEVDSQGDREDDEGQGDEDEEDKNGDEEKEKTHPSHLHTLVLT